MENVNKLNNNSNIMLSLKKQEERRGDFKKGIDIKCEKKKLEDFRKL